MKKILTVVLTLIIIVSCCVIPANAALAPLEYGNVDGSFGVEILDAICIQKHLVGLYQIESNRYEAADVDGDCEISVIDATYIQQYLANLIPELPSGRWYCIDKWLYNVCANYSSGKAIAGEPVTFIADGFASPGPDTFKLFVNGELVDENSDGNTLTYTFEQAGTYSLLVTVCDKWGASGFGWTSFKDDEYVVVDKPEDLTKPYITGVYREDIFSYNSEVFTNVINGTAPYQYKYTLMLWDEVRTETEYSDSNIFTLDVKDLVEKLHGGPIHGLTLIVEVKDANGNTDSFSYNCSIDDKPIG